MLLSFFAQTRPQLIIFFLLGIFITIVTLMPGEYLPPTPGTDKTAHLASFFGWAFAVSAFRTQHTRKLWVIVALWGGVIEVIQPAFGRWMEALDFAADVIGAVTGGGAGYLFYGSINYFLSPKK